MPTYTDLLTNMEQSRTRRFMADDLVTTIQHLMELLPADSDIQADCKEALPLLQKIALKGRRDLTYAIAEFEEYRDGKGN